MYGDSMLQVARIGIITAANSNPANSGQYYIDMFTRPENSASRH